MTPEGKVKAKVNRRLAAYPAIFKFMPVQMGMGIPGLDYFLCVGGKFAAVETKVKGKHLTPRQLQTKETIEKAGGKVFVVDDDASLDVLMKWVHKHYRPTPTAQAISMHDGHLLASMFQNGPW